MGRPPLGSEAKTEIVRIRVTKAELKALEASAKRAGTTVAGLLVRPWRELKGD